MTTSREVDWADLPMNVRQQLTRPFVVQACGFTDKAGGPCILPVGHEPADKHDDEDFGQMTAERLQHYRHEAWKQQERAALSDYQRGYVDGFDAPANVAARAHLESHRQ